VIGERALAADLQGIFFCNQVADRCGLGAAKHQTARFDTAVTYPVIAS
jgi:hypothetical protein